MTMPANLNITCVREAPAEHEHGLSRVARRDDGHREDDRERHDLQHVVARHRVHRARREDVQERLREGERLCLDGGPQRRGVPGEPDPDARPDEVDDGQADGEGGRRDELEVEERLRADPADFPHVAGPRYALHDAAEHKGRDHQLDEVQEDVADELKPPGPGRQAGLGLAAQPPPEKASGDKPEQDLAGEREAAKGPRGGSMGGRAGGSHGLFFQRTAGTPSPKARRPAKMDRLPAPARHA
jgi:hypothetical protein